MCIQNLVGNAEGKNHLKDVGVDGMVMNMVFIGRENIC
jgi:hypothetical protein